MSRRFKLWVGLGALLALLLSYLVFFGGGGMGGIKKTKGERAQIEVKHYAKLPEVNLGWLSLRDHFIATVGPNSGQGAKLKHLLVLADAKLQPNSRFPDHPHQNMEILTWVAKGTLQHLDNKGMSQAVPAESLQLMSARDGIFHAEGNSRNEPLRIFQIWIRPTSNGSGAPVVTQVVLKKPGFNLLAGPQGVSGAGRNEVQLRMMQSAWVYASSFKNGEEQQLVVPEGQFGYGVSIGSLKWNGQGLEDGDGVVVSSGRLIVQGVGQAIIILQTKE